MVLSRDSFPNLQSRVVTFPHWEIIVYSLEVIILTRHLAVGDIVLSHPSPDRESLMIYGRTIRGITSHFVSIFTCPTSPHPLHLHKLTPLLFLPQQRHN